MKVEANSAPSRPQPSPQPESQQKHQPATTGMKHPGAAASSRRGEIDFRTLIQGLETSSSLVRGDGLVFAQLIQPASQLSDDDDGSSLGGGSGILAANPDTMGTQLVDELVQRLPVAPPAAFTVTLLMPNLGKVQVRAGKREDLWEVELGFARRSTFERLKPQQNACEAALAAAMGSSVRLCMVDEVDT